jgi:PadR family transcriptional regulator, regulatory protein PadR
MGRGPRMTMAALRVLKLFLEDPTAKRYGLDISKGAELPSGTVYEILMRFEQTGWLTSTWEEVDPTIAGRPRRRLYQLTPDGVPSARLALAEARQKLVTTRRDRRLLNPKEAPTWKYSSGYSPPSAR